MVCAYISTRGGEERGSMSVTLPTITGKFKQLDSMLDGQAVITLKNKL